MECWYLIGSHILLNFFLKWYFYVVTFGCYGAKISEVYLGENELLIIIINLGAAIHTPRSKNVKSVKGIPMVGF